MYRSFFGLKQLPFKISPDLNFFYKQASRVDIVQALLYSIERGDGIIKVEGEIGVGKTTLMRLLLEQLPDNYQKIYVSSPNLKPIDFLRFVCRELGVEDAETDTKADLVKKLNHYLIDAYAQNQRVVMLIDEAQSMTLDSLEEVRLLGNLETGEDKLLQILLCGQPELETNLNDERAKPLRDRIANSVQVVPLNAEEVYQYLNYRMRVAGHMETEVFSKKMAERILGLTGGLPRSINILADKLLMAAFSDGGATVEDRHFAMVGYHEKESFLKRHLVHGLLMFLILLLIFSIAWLVHNWQHNQQVSSILFPAVEEQMLSVPEVTHAQAQAVEETDATTAPPKVMEDVASEQSSEQRFGTSLEFMGLTSKEQKVVLAENFESTMMLRNLGQEGEITWLQVKGGSNYASVMQVLRAQLTAKQLASLHLLIKLDALGKGGQVLFWSADLSAEEDDALARHLDAKVRFALKPIKIKDFVAIIER